ncbi:MAG TPA: hypothetical protein VGY99_27550, partial [Candidatus Binataceae bacterium]|nr:hypothetical protein [Candidatus Binataceae bacterium]
MATVLVQIGSRADLFHDGDTAYASVMVNGHLETYSILSKDYRQYLQRRYHADTEKAAPLDQVAAAQGTLAGIDWRQLFWPIVLPHRKRLLQLHRLASPETLTPTSPSCLTGNAYSNFTVLPHRKRLLQLHLRGNRRCLYILAY